MKPVFSSLSLGVLSLALAACATYPQGPSLSALPGSYSNFDQFRADDAECQAYARQTIGPPPGQVASDSGVNSAAVGTMIGAAAGALLGSASGNAGSGAALGAGTGLLFGSLAGSDAASSAGGSQQDRYDGAYVQCMYAKGHQVPVSASVASRLEAERRSAQAVQPPMPPAPPPGAVAPPPQAPAYPPPGTPPPPGY
jgi:hypothetical protein